MSASTLMRSGFVALSGVLSSPAHASRRLSLAAILAACCAFAWPASAITITLNFDPNVGTGERAVFEEAASRWESFIVSGEGFTMNVAASTSLPTGFLGLASNYQSSNGRDGSGFQQGTPEGGDILFNANVPFFVDPTPGDDSEYMPSAISPTYLLADGSDALVLSSFDLLSTAIHEIGHALGFGSAFADFTANLTASQSGAYYAYAFASTPTLGDPVQDYLAGFFTNGSALMPLVDPAGEEASSVGGFPSHLEDVGVIPDGSGRFSPGDALNPGLNPGERRLISFVDLDILADAHGYSVIPEPGTALLLGLGLSGLAARRRRA